MYTETGYAGPMIVTRTPLQCIVWDFDGVLNDNHRNGRFLWADGFEDTFGQPIRGFQNSVFGPELLTGQADIATRIAGWIAETGAETTPEAVIDYWLSRDLYPNADIIALMDKMAQRRLRQVVLTNCDRRRADWVDRCMTHFPQVERVFASARLGIAKPDPAVFQTVSETLDLPPGALMMIDDASRNVNAAGKAGWRTFKYSRLGHQALVRSLKTERL